VTIFSFCTDNNYCHNVLISFKMLASGVTYGVMIATLVAVAVYAIIVSRRMEVNSVKNFVRCGRRVCDDSAINFVP
jgi:hypothetical protein